MRITVKSEAVGTIGIGGFNFPVYNENTNPYFALNHLEIVLGSPVPWCIVASLPDKSYIKTPNVVYLNIQAVYYIIMSVNMDKRYLDSLRIKWGFYMADITTRSTLDCILKDGGV